MVSKKRSSDTRTIHIVNIECTFVVVVLFNIWWWSRKPIGKKADFFKKKRLSKPKTVQAAAS